MLSRGAEGALIFSIELADGRVRPTGGQGTARSTGVLGKRGLWSLSAQIFAEARP